MKHQYDFKSQKLCTKKETPSSVLYVHSHFLKKFPLLSIHFSLPLLLVGNQFPYFVNYPSFISFVGMSRHMCIYLHPLLSYRKGAYHTYPFALYFFTYQQILEIISYHFIEIFLIFCYGHVALPCVAVSWFLQPLFYEWPLGSVSIFVIAHGYNE